MGVWCGSKPKAQVFSAGLGVNELRSVEERSSLFKPSLWAGDVNCVSPENVCERAGESVDGVTFWHLGTGCLVLGKLVDAALVAWVLGKGLVEEGVNEGCGFFYCVLARSDGDDVGVVVLAAKLCGSG